MDPAKQNTPYSIIQQQEESQQIGKTTLLLVCVVSVSIIGIGYFVFLQQQQLKCMFSLLLDDISKLNDKLSKCPVMSGKIPPSDCFGTECSLSPNKKASRGTQVDSYEIKQDSFEITPEYQIVMRNKPTPIILSSNSAQYNGSDDEDSANDEENILAAADEYDDSPANYSEDTKDKKQEKTPKKKRKKKAIANEDA